MILVLLGTFPLEFKRPLIEIDQLCEQGIIAEEVIVQNGFTSITSKHLTLKPFLSPDALTELYIKARIIITHSGTGSLVKGIKLNKKVIAIARLQKYGEVVDNHQEEILEEFAKLNYILPWREGVPLETILRAVDSFRPANYTSNTENIIQFLTGYMDNL